MKYLLYVIAALMISSRCFAQFGDPDITFMKASLSAEDLNANYSSIYQNGYYNEGFITQSSALDIALNTAAIHQAGNSNRSSISQHGNGNFSFTGQMGSFNSADIGINGNFCRTDVLQAGNENRISQELTGNGINFILIQVGDRNQVNQFGAGAVKGIIIQQRGNDMQLDIANNNYYK